MAPITRMKATNNQFNFSRRISLSVRESREYRIIIYTHTAPIINAGYLTTANQMCTIQSCDAILKLIYYGYARF